MSSHALSNPNPKNHEGMVCIPEGYFWMGADDGSDAERPVHRVWLHQYWIDETLVTNQQFAAFIAATGYQTTAERPRKNAGAAGSQTWRTFATQERADHPVVNVSWPDAHSFANWLGKRLPSEAEWEKAARGGIERALYPWGNESPSETHARWLQSQTKAMSDPPTAIVRSFPPNSYGIYDMAGNVWQWCSDWYQDHAYQTSEGCDPKGPLSGQFRTRRGAAWNVRESFRLRCANRGAMPPDRFWPNLGFRCVQREF